MDIERDILAPALDNLIVPFSSIQSPNSSFHLLQTFVEFSRSNKSINGVQQQHHGHQFAPAPDGSFGQSPEVDDEETEDDEPEDEDEDDDEESELDDELERELKLLIEEDEEDELDESV